MSLRPTTKDVQTLMTEVKRLFGDESGVQLDDTDIIRWANEAQMEIVNVNGALKAKSSITTTPGQGTYTFPDVKIQRIASLHYDNVLLPNTPFAEAERLLMLADAQQNTPPGVPEFWYEWAGEFTLWPTPAEAKTVTVYYTAYPADLTGDPVQVLSLPDKWFPAIVNYIMSKAYEMDEDHQASQLAEQRFQTSVNMQNGDEREAQDMAYPVVQEVWY